MSINVYWASLEKEWMLAQEPESIAKSFFSNGWSFDKKEKHTMLVNCPTVTNSLKKYNEKLLKGEICVVKGSVLQKKLDSKSDDFSKIKEIVDKLIFTNISNDKAKLYEDLKKLKITLGDKLPDEIICPITKEICTF